VFVPDRVTLRRGRAYRLVLTNPSGVYHNFVATEFLLHGAYWLLTRIGEAGETEWYVVPHKLGLYEFKCTVVGHDGMRGVLEVVA
jgi:plastocyanin